MPIYEYHCCKCNGKKERFSSVEFRDREIQCDNCGAVMRRVGVPTPDVKYETQPNVFRKV